MKKSLLILFLLITLMSVSCKHSTEVTADYRVIPLPANIIVTDSFAGFRLTDRTLITYPQGNDSLRHNAELLSQYLQDLTNLRIDITDSPVTDNAIILLDTLRADNPEAYTLTITDSAITINGATPAGNFYGIQTLRKSVPSQGDLSVTFPAACISDSPRFPYRGAMLDVCRHFFPVDSVKRYIDILALHNINRFHWHLSDDQGWRIEIKKRPKLTEIGSVRKGTCIGRDFESSDSIPYGGFFTQEEARDIVKYAADRYITVIPEIDLPGHMLAALTAYPELGCTGGPYELWQRWGVSEDLLCAGNDSTYAFIDDVLGEIADIFPSEYIHVGGDECPKMRWQECPKCQQKARRLGLKADASGTVEQKLQSYVMSHAGDFLASRGRKMIGWDEILEGGSLADGATIMSWRGEDGAREAARMGHDAIMTPTGYCYFDYYQTLDTEGEPLSIGGYVPVEKVYSFNPTPDYLSDSEKTHILGVQANLWTEYITDFSTVEYRVLPRMAALAEVQWRDYKDRDYKEFTDRLPQLIAHYRANSYNYATHVFDVNGKLTTNPATGTIDAVLLTTGGAPIYYTLDGSEPTEASALYEGPVKLRSTATIKAVAIRPEGRSRVYTDSVNFNKATARAITLANEPHSNYRADGALTLVNGRYGSRQFSAGGWLGFHGTDLDATIDLDSLTEISQVTLRTLVDVGNWILDTEGITVSVSTDGKTYTEVASAKYPVVAQNTPVDIHAHTFDFAPVTTRYVRVVASCVPQMPAWEARAAKGDPAFLFIDEILIN